MHDIDWLKRIGPIVCEFTNKFSIRYDFFSSNPYLLRGNKSNLKLFIFILVNHKIKIKNMFILIKYSSY